MQIYQLDGKVGVGTIRRYEQIDLHGPDDRKVSGQSIAFEDKDVGPVSQSGR